MRLINIKRAISRELWLIWLINTLLVCSQVIFSQVGEGGNPPGYDILCNAVSTTNVPIDFYVEDIRETDYWQAQQGIPMPVAKLVSVDYSMENSGTHTILSGGETVWFLHLKARDAVAVMLYYDDFYIPEGGRLFIYNTDKTQVLGAYTHCTHPSGGRFATEFIGGDELILEYVASTSSNEKPRIAISEIGYGYNTSALREFCAINTYAAAAFCEVNINCEEGEAWQNEKKGVCYTVQKIGRQAYICTGTLLNNTAEDFSPFLLTALHCAYDGVTMASDEDLEQWMFYFHRERENCNNTSLGKISKTMTGCSLLAATGMGGGSDGLLLMLKDTIPDDYDVFYNGWDCTGIAAKSGVCIHHPQGDYQKISTFDESIRTYTFVSSEFIGDADAHWNAIFKPTVNGHGVTEMGSSGSPLFNENKLVVGTLSGGSSTCYNLRGVNLYGNFLFHWNKYKTDSTTRMDVWLDPLNKGVKTLSGRYRIALRPAPLNLKAVYLGPSVSLTWSEPQSPENPLYYNVYRNNAKIDETTTLSYSDNNLIYGSVVYSVSAVYEDDKESSFASTALSIIKYKAPSGFFAEQKENNPHQIELRWHEPVYEQTIFWGTLTPAYIVGFEDKTPFYFGQKWSADEIGPFHLKTIKAIRFFPIEKNTYGIFITQGENSYKQSIADSLLKSREINTIDLETPFIIDGSKSLIVSIFVSNVGTDFPAACDNGPAVSGKGNLCAISSSADDLEWELLNDNEEPGAYNYNFIISAIVSSENGKLPILNRKMDASKRNAAIMKNNTALLRKTTIPLIDNEVSLRDAVPAPFPEITKYRIYKDGLVFVELNVPTIFFVDNVVTKEIVYEISAFYDLVESDKTDKVYISIVDDPPSTPAILLFPTLFTDYMTLQDSEFVSRIEVKSVSGKTCLIINNPGQTINTSSLAPGVYFIRIIDVHSKQKTVKAIKVK